MIINERIERYVDACPAAIAGQSGHTTTFKLAIALVQGFGLNEALALPFLRRYNVRCQPPWREHELRHKRGAANLQPRQGQTLKATRLSPIKTP
jgi:hypothetical protein